MGIAGLMDGGLVDEMLAAGAGAGWISGLRGGAVLPEEHSGWGGGEVGETAGVPPPFETVCDSLGAVEAEGVAGLGDLDSQAKGMGSFR